jgi:hypothetical protein
MLPLKQISTSAWAYGRADCSARVVQAGLFFVPVVLRDRFRIERIPNDLGVGRAGWKEGKIDMVKETGLDRTIRVARAVAA